VESKQAAGVRGGCLFVRKLSSAKMFEFENELFVLLEHVQAHMNHIDKEMDMRNAYGLIQSS
jgi:hypothetical protein